MHATAQRETRRPWSVLILLSVAQFMVVLLIGGLLLLGGRISDVLARRSVFLSGLSLFTLASLLSGLAESGGMLIASRAAQGVGAALLTPAALSIVTSYYSGAQRAKALGAWSAIGSAGAAVGVVLGGVLTTWLSWEWIFLVNVPIGLTAGVLTLRVLPAMSSAAVARAL